MCCPTYKLRSLCFTPVMAIHHNTCSGAPSMREQAPSQNGLPHRNKTTSTNLTPTDSRATNSVFQRNKRLHCRARATATTTTEHRQRSHTGKTFVHTMYTGKHRRGQQDPQKTKTSKVFHRPTHISSFTIDTTKHEIRITKQQRQTQGARR